MILRCRQNKIQQLRSLNGTLINNQDQIWQMFFESFLQRWLAQTTNQSMVGLSSLLQSLISIMLALSDKLLSKRWKILSKVWPLIKPQDQMGFSHYSLDISGLLLRGMQFKLFIFFLTLLFYPRIVSVLILLSFLNEAAQNLLMTFGP